MKKIGFIGAGNMGGALIKGVCKSVGPNQVLIFDTDEEKVKNLCDTIGCVSANSASAVCADVEYVVLAVKPQVLRAVQSEINTALQENSQNGMKQKIISIAAGISLQSLAEIPGQIGLNMPIIRMLPNTPAEIGQGLIIYSENYQAGKDICCQIEEMFRFCGIVENVSENMLDMASAVSGCTPAFAYMFIEALADGAVRSGVPRDRAIKYAAQAVKGAAAMVLETGRHPEVLKDAVCSPAGSTIVGVATLEDGGFRSAAANAVFNANEKNKQLGKK